MPGKVNPVMCESTMQVAARVMGNDQTVALSGAAGGQFQLNIMMPVMGHAVLESIRLLAARRGPSSTSAWRDWRPIRPACEAAVEESLSMVTSLNPLIGYENAASAGQRSLRHRQDHPPTVPRKRDSAGSHLAPGARSLADDPAPGVYAPGPAQ